MPAIAAAMLGPSPAVAGTDIRIFAQDGSAMTGRTLDYAAPLSSHLIIQPRDAQFASSAPGGAAGLSWTGQYGFVYVDGFDLEVQIDGMNEAGLGFGALYLPDYTSYTEGDAIDTAIALSNLQFGAWVLSQFATVEEVRLALSTVEVWGEPVAVMDGRPLPLRYVIHDSNGNSIIIEFIEGDLRLYENVAGVLTNAPPYDWHLTNLRNYTDLSLSGEPVLALDDFRRGAVGQGDALINLPGGPTSPSRFVSTAFALALVDRPADATGALVLAQKLLNRVDLPLGLLRASGGDAQSLTEHTQWAVFRDHRNKIFYWRTYGDMTLRSLALNTVNFEPADARRALPLVTEAPTVVPIDPASIPLESSAP